VKDNCALLHLPLIFRSGPSDDVVKISPLSPLVAMATNFGTKIDYNLSPMKNNYALFSPTPLILGPGYSMLSF